MKKTKYIAFFDSLTIKDVPIAGGKNASLGEMYKNLSKHGVEVPFGFATLSYAYFEFLKHNDLNKKIAQIIKEYTSKKKSLSITGKLIRNLILKSKLSPTFEKEINEAYISLCKFYKKQNIDVAIRSSATAEDLPSASFAGQQESYLNIKGIKNVIKACIKCYASLFTDRAIAYREKKKFSHIKIALSIGIQKMIRSDKAASGVMFTLDTESGFDKIVLINAIYGLGEYMVQGIVDPDEYIIFKPFIGTKKIPIIEKSIGTKEKKLIYSFEKNKTVKPLLTTSKEQNSFVLTDEEILKLSKWACIIEKHYKKPMDIEWAKDGNTNKLYIVQARPETVASQKNNTLFESYILKDKRKPILEGIAIGEKIATGKVQIIKNINDINKFKKDSILVTYSTTPDWVPIMKKAKGIITDHGGRTSHAAIVSRELGIPAIIGTSIATKKLKENQEVTISCVEGEVGRIYDKELKYITKTTNLSTLPKISTPIMINISTPNSAFRWWHLPCQGIGLVRLEFIISNMIKIHPLALTNFSQLKNKKTKKIIEEMTKNYKSKKDYFIDILGRGIAKIAASQYPYPVIVRMSDFKTNEYLELIGGDEFEPKEENPMIGFRGASRYYSDLYKPGFKLECEAMRFARETLGFDNIILMIPFCRTIKEADLVLKVLKENKLERGENKLKIFVMCEIPSNVILADEFAKRFDGFSIGSNDLTQLTLGVDRDSERLSTIFDPSDMSIKKSISHVIREAHKKKVKVGICGQAPSDSPDFAKFLLKEKIDSISLNPDSVVDTIKHLAKIKKRK